MEELYELRSYIEQGRYNDALMLIGEMEEMSREDKLNKIRSFLDVLLLHLIKQHAEQRSTRSWEVSIRNALRQIVRTNQREKSRGYYLDQIGLQEAINDAYENALDLASLEAFGGVYTALQLAELIDEAKIKTEALHVILNTQRTE
jgi:hypothetical protein